MAYVGDAEGTGTTKRKHLSPEALDASLLPKHRKPIPHAFMLDAAAAWQRLNSVGHRFTLFGSLLCWLLRLPLETSKPLSNIASCRLSTRPRCFEHLRGTKPVSTHCPTLSPTTLL